MKVLDLFSGLGGWSAAFKDRGHDVVTVDIESKFNPTICADIMSLRQEDLGRFDVVLASPPCQCFSVLVISKNWRKGVPKNKRCLDSINLARRTLSLIQEINPRFWFLENPRGMLRRAIGLPQTTITYCQYGAPYMKPTDLWGVFPGSWVPKKCNYGDKCHPPSPRTANNGIQGMSSSEERAKIPYGLSKSVCECVEKDIKSPSPGETPSPTNLYKYLSINKD